MPGFTLLHNHRQLARGETDQLRRHLASLPRLLDTSDRKIGIIAERNKIICRMYATPPYEKTHLGVTFLNSRILFIRRNYVRLVTGYSVTICFWNLYSALSQPYNPWWRALEVQKCVTYKYDSTNISIFLQLEVRSFQLELSRQSRKLSARPKKLLL